MALAGCGQTAAPQETAPAEAEPAVESTAAAEAETSAEEATQLEDSLVIYTTHPEDLVEAISDEFTEKTGVPVEFINLKGELADRIRSEKDNPQADIMFGGDTATYMVLQSEGCYAPTSPSWADDVDEAYKEAEGYWYGTYRTPMVLFYNSEAMTAEEAPTDWTDLTKEEYAGKIVTRDSLSSSMRSTIVSLVQNIKASDSEEAAWSFIEALGKNTKNYYNSGSMMFQAVGKGEASVSMAVINDVLKNRDANEMPLEMVIPASGAVVITDCIAATANAPHPNAAAAFIDFVGSKECQVMAANDFNRMPVTDGFLSECPEWMQTEFSALPVDWSEISANQSEWLEKWETDYLDAEKAVASE
ncbi:MAG: extracellular solute-binding protein [Lachnospiraceae bacterium]|nr:extracellular solute-binding protein [Lachnospiraceae bacterium]